MMTKPKKKLKKMLQIFEIESGTIRCTDAIALQALIPYEKRLLQLFPQIKESTKHVFHLMRSETEYIGLKQGVMLNGLAKAHWNLTPMLRVLENFSKVTKRKFFISRWLKGKNGQG